MKFFPIKHFQKLSEIFTVLCVLFNSDKKKILYNALAGTRT